MILSLLLSIPKITWPSHHSSTYSRSKSKDYSVQETTYKSRRLTVFPLFGLELFFHKDITVYNNLSLQVRSTKMDFKPNFSRSAWNNKALSLLPKILQHLQLSQEVWKLKLFWGQKKKIAGCRHIIGLF